MNKIDWLIDEHLIEGKALLDRAKQELGSGNSDKALETLDQIDALVFDCLFDLKTACEITGLSPESLVELAKDKTVNIQMYDQSGKVQKETGIPAMFRHSQINRLCDLIQRVA